MKVNKDYSYIPDLQAAILHERLQADKGMSKRRTLRPEDPRRLGLIPKVPPPPIDTILESHVNRGIGAIPTLCETDEPWITASHPHHQSSVLDSLNQNKLFVYKVLESDI